MGQGWRSFCEKFKLMRKLWKPIQSQVLAFFLLYIEV